MFYDIARGEKTEDCEQDKQNKNYLTKILQHQFLYFLSVRFLKYAFKTANKFFKVTSTKKVPSNVWQIFGGR
jgi:hypothetical protein